MFVLLLAVPALAASPGSFAALASAQEEDPGRSDDPDRVEAWRAFFDRADRAFFAAPMNTADVQKWLREAREEG